MSEKRILIKEFTISPCTGCSGAGENDCDNCYDWDTWNSCLTRKQAIEKMAKAMCRKSNGGTCDGCSVFEEPDKERCKEIYMHPEFVDGAEAALNALLEGYNDKR